MINIPAYIQENARLLSDLGNGDAISIETFCLQLLDVWAQAMEFVRVMKDGKCDKVWSANAPYQQVISRVYDVEIQSGETHRLRNARPAERSISQLNS